jgi:hypothetical protein
MSRRDSGPPDKEAGPLDDKGPAVVSGHHTTLDSDNDIATGRQVGDTFGGL